MYQSPFVERIIKAIMTIVGNPSQMAGITMFAAHALCE
jgi:hypothetical protein